MQEHGGLSTETYQVAGLGAARLQGSQNGPRDNLGFREVGGRRVELTHICRNPLRLSRVDTVSGGFLQVVCRDESPGGFDAAGLDNDHVNTELFNFHAQCIAERLKGVLGGVVPGTQGRGNTPRHRGDIQDAPTALCAHMRQHQLGEARQAKEVHLELAARRRWGRLQ